MFDAQQIAEWSKGEWRPAPPDAIAGVSHDTRTLEAEELYVAIRGDRFDGHAFIGEAVERGASGCMVESGVEVDTDAAPMLLVKDTRRALCDLAAGYRAGHQARIVGITGSAGKTTVVAIVANILSQVLPTATTRGNWNNDIGMPLSLLGMEPTDEAGIFELATNHPGEIGALSATLRPDIGVITNIGPAHIGFFGTLDAIAREKGAMLAALPSDGRAVIEADQPHSDLLAGLAACPVVTIGRTADADYTLAARSPEGTIEIVETATGESCSVRLPLPGDHTAVNAAMAAAVARLFGIPWDAVQSGIESFTPCGMRWETVDVDGVTVINDAYNANPLSMRAALQAFGNLETSGTRWLVLGDMCELGDLEQDEHMRLGREIAEAGWTHLVTVGGCGAWIGEAAGKAGAGSIEITRCDGVEDAAAALNAGAVRGDAILLKASRALQLERIIDLLSA